MLLFVAIAYTCSDNIDIRHGYEFRITHLLVPKKVKIVETIEIRCQLERSGRYGNTTYKLRYFQPDGMGSLKIGDNAPFLPNDLYELNDETFRLYYTSQSEDQQVIDVYFFDNFGNSYIICFSFNNQNTEEEG